MPVHHNNPTQQVSPQRTTSNTSALDNATTSSNLHSTPIDTREPTSVDESPIDDLPPWVRRPPSWLSDYICHPRLALQIPFLLQQIFLLRLPQVCVILSPIMFSIINFLIAIESS